MTLLLFLAMQALDSPDRKNSLTMMLYEASKLEHVDSRMGKLLRDLVDRGATPPPKGGSHLRVVVSNAPTEAKAA